MGMLLLDVQKAFDSVNHKILFQKLDAMGINTSWFKSYLSDRQQLVQVDGVQSALLEVSCGVPQGSLLGPVLYLCYSNDMVMAVKNKLLLYADDSVIIASDKDPSVVAHNLSLDLNSSNNWLINNDLSLHVGKTELILFGSRKKLRKASDFHVSYNDHIIKPASSIKYLGVTLDQHLSGEVFADSLIKKATGRLKFLYRYSSYFNQRLRKRLCSALLQCHLDYCCSSWYTGLSKFNKNKLQVFQNKMIRFILNLSPRDHVGQEHFDAVKFLNVQNGSRQLRLNHMFNIFHSLGPSYLKQFFTKVSDTHSYATRSRYWNFSIPRIGSYTKNSFFYQATLDWNKLPSSIKSIDDKTMYKVAMKKHLASNARLTH